jgi:hypothetical protein
MDRTTPLILDAQEIKNYTQDSHLLQKMSINIMFTKIFYSILFSATEFKQVSSPSASDWFGQLVNWEGDTQMPANELRTEQLQLHQEAKKCDISNIKDFQNKQSGHETAFVFHTVQDTTMAQHEPSDRRLVNLVSEITSIDEVSVKNPDMDMVKAMSIDMLNYEVSSNDQ